MFKAAQARDKDRRDAEVAGDGVSNMVTSGFVGVAGWGLTFEW